MLRSKEGGLLFKARCNGQGKNLLSLNRKKAVLTDQGSQNGPVSSLIAGKDIPPCCLITVHAYNTYPRPSADTRDTYIMD